MGKSTGTETIVQHLGLCDAIGENTYVAGAY